MPETAIDLPTALQMARSFNLAFNSAYMYGGGHQSTADSAANFYAVLRPMLDQVGIVTISVDKGSVYLENHCVDKWVAVSRITGRFTKAGVQSVSFDRDTDLDDLLALFYLLGALIEFQDVPTMKGYLNERRVRGVKINYVVYQKVTVDDTVINKNVLSATQMLLNSQQAGALSYGQTEQGSIVNSVSEVLSLHGAAHDIDISRAGSGDASRLSQEEYDRFITAQIKALNSQLTATEKSGDSAPLSPAEMLETIYTLKENVLENIRLQQESGKLLTADEQAINNINQLSYQVIVRLIREEYRSDRNISVKRLAQIIRRMLPDIKELKHLLPQLKDGLFAEGMTPSEYLSLVKELSKELDSDELMQVMVEASDQIGLTLVELIEGIKEAPEEAARLIVLAAEIKKGGVRADEQQMSTVLSDYIEKVSRALALQSPEAASRRGGNMLKSVVTRIERDILDRLKTQDLSSDTVSEVAQQLVNQFADTLANLKGEWVRVNIKGTKKPSEESVLSIIEQIAENGREDYGVTKDIRSILIAHGYSGETIDGIVTKARQRAALAITHSVVCPPGVFSAKNTLFLLDREIKLNARYNTPFATILISYEKVIDLRTFTLIEVTPDTHIQLTNQSLQLLKDMHLRDTDIIGIHTVDNVSIPFLICSMTKPAGALFVKKRIETDFPCHEFVVNDITVHIEPTVTLCDFDKFLTPDTPSYLKAIYLRHCQPQLQ